jgi:hypothetical protein
MAPDRISVCGTAVAEHASGAIGWGATQQERDGTKDAQARGAGKVPSFKGRKAYLSRRRTTRRAKSHRRLSRGCLHGTDRPRADFARTSAHVAHVYARVKLGTCLRHVHSTIKAVSHGVTQRESLGDSTYSRRWGFPQGPQLFLRSHRAS